MVRQRVALRPTSRRTPDEWLAVRFRPLLAVLNRLALRLPPTSRRRRALLGRAVRSAFEAANRRDYEVNYASFDDDVELITPPQLVALGFKPQYRGLEDRIRFQREWDAEWGEWRFELDELIDLGDNRLLVTGHMSGSGSSSGASFGQEYANLVTLSPHGLVVREQPFVDHGEALAAAGLS